MHIRLQFNEMFLFSFKKNIYKIVSRLLCEIHLCHSSHSLQLNEKIFLYYERV